MVLLPLGRGLGLGREALAALVSLAFEEPLINEVYARFAAGNTAARNLVARVGFCPDCAAKVGEQESGMCERSIHRSGWCVSK